ncbi:MAG: Ig-like domain repeat protein [Methanobrevibacter sp.]|uniref:putative glycoside hydrolase n=1 Tax=Methanobrevibacter sp. TaxID=66852 RepID=UPI001B40843F|nr:Ig-like domain repeat protein [Methanobrevibacter sp.]MBP3791525.1 Ig-like domain repeat protein [Methanobrevibacter sp.]
MGDDSQPISLDNDETLLEETSEPMLGESEESLQDDDSSQDSIVTSLESNDTNIVKGNYIEVKLADENGTGIANKTVKFELNKVTSEVKTDDDGIAKLKVDVNPGTYTVKCSFEESGYTSSSLSKEIFVISTSTSKIKGSDYVAYIGIKNKYTVLLTVGGLPLAGRDVTFTINGKTYVKTTNSKGIAKLNIKLPKGTYTMKYSYAGEDNIKKSSGSSKITVKKGVPVKITKYYSKIYRNKQAGKFKVKITDVRGDVVAGKKVKFTVNKKTYTKKTSKKGIATVTIKLKTGSYKVKAKFLKDSTYNKASKKFSIKVKPKQARNNGFWMLSTDMKGVDFDKLQKYGTKHIFLNAKAIERFGKSYLVSWIKDAKSHGIKVHLWMQVFYKSGGWQNPIKNGKIDYSLIKSKVNEAKSYAKIKGVSGIHFDYIRFPGNAYQYSGAVKAVNYFTKKACSAIHGVNKKIIVSAAVMPEPSSMKKYYAQDIPTMSKYLDVIVPMVYKGNYNAGGAWIKQTTKIFISQSKKAKIWTGLQTYKSDSNVNRLSASELMKDADAAALAGAYGVIMFRYGLLNFFNFNEV